MANVTMDCTVYGKAIVIYLYWFGIVIVKTKIIKPIIPGKKGKLLSRPKYGFYWAFMEIKRLGYEVTN